MKLLMIADDFTGSNDTGVQFSKKGLKTVVSLYTEEMNINTENIDVLVVDSESRFDKSERAYEKVGSVVKSFNGEALVYKKLDSTLRGNIGAEIEGAMDASGIKLAIVTPAFPNNGRTVEKGVLYLKGVPVDQTEVAKDPKNPVTCSYIPELLRNETRKQVALIDFKEILKGNNYVAQKIDELVNIGNEIIVVDARTNEELNIIAGASALLKRKFILSGSAGLAEFVPQNLFPETASVVNAETLTLTKEGSMIILAGSVSDVLRNQVEVAVEKEEFKVIDLNIENVILNKWNEEKQRIISEMKKLTEQKHNIIVRSAKGREEITFAKSVGVKEGLSDFDVSERIACFYGEIAKLITEQIEVSLLMLSGGDIAIKAVNAMQISGIEIEEEIAPGIPFGYFIRMDNSRIPVVTKAGSFGKEDAIIEVVNYLKRR
jgi:D-threonate/D-erythronate kinase